MDFENRAKTLERLRVNGEQWLPFEELIRTLFDDPKERVDILLRFTQERGQCLMCNELIIARTAVILAEDKRGDVHVLHRKHHPHLESQGLTIISGLQSLHVEKLQTYFQARAILEEAACA